MFFVLIGEAGNLLKFNPICDLSGFSTS